MFQSALFFFSFLTSPTSSSTASSNYTSPASTSTSLVSNDAGLQPPSSNADIFIDDVDESLPSAEEAPSFLLYNMLPQSKTI